MVTDHSDLKDKIMEYIYNDENSGKICTSPYMVQALLPEIDTVKGTNIILSVLDVLKNEAKLVDYDRWSESNFPVYTNIRLTVDGRMWKEDGFQFWNRKLTKKLNKKIDLITSAIK